ncbi:class I SAM-dependent methyltransferase [Pseudomonas chlororaphis]|uniref:class I SAM-dependent methyltransferase n=1 Tax=Pseudomonas chlororaphis TaxID=587753 RepID=UPI00240845EB|nr:class I SAM-dependent methyltransferase [Pseudomonas chlororaphis]
MGFFDQYELFYKTSQTSPLPHRLNSRFKAIIERNKAKLEGKRVLDIASHDGRWTFAALKAGAAHVTGIEPRQELIDNARSTFSSYGVPDDRYTFECGDIFDRIRGKKFDVVLCLGFYYHTIRHAELLDLIERTGADFVVIDTEVTPTADQILVGKSSDPRLVYGNPYGIQLLVDPVDEQQMAWTDSMTRNGRTVVGRPSRAAVDFLANHFGYNCETFNWPEFFVKHEETASSMVDYSEGWRDSFFLSRKP